MPAPKKAPVPTEIASAHDGEPRVLNELFEASYLELKRLASIAKRRSDDQTLSPTALVNEVWLRLSSAPHLKVESYLHFKRLAAKAMRQVLIEAARRRTARKRGGNEAVMITLDDSSLDSGLGCNEQLLALDTALRELERLSPRQGMIVESKFFGGLEFKEIAELLLVSESTIVREWRSARAWLGKQIHDR